MGGGQLGRMFAISALQMGYKVAILEPNIDCPAKKLATYHIATKYDDKSGLDELIKVASVITTEFENVPASSMAYLNQFAPVYPNAKAILIAQNRIAEKTFFNQHSINTTKYCAISNIADINQVDQMMFPAILKTNTLGYDGKGQKKVTNHDELVSGFNELNQVPCILENLVDLKQEVSIIVARNHYEKIAYPVAQNIHHNGILDLTIVRKEQDNPIYKQITQFGLDLIEKLDYIGVLAIEFFITQDNQILANEMAPRPHNSGHYTLDSCTTSQFEQQVRSICQLKLGAIGFNTNAIMLNLLGDIWQDETTHPKWEKVLAKYTNLKLHLYEKTIAKPGRKMGHLTIQGQDIDQLLAQIKEIKTLLNILN